MDDNTMRSLLAGLPEDMHSGLEKREAQGERFPFPHALDGDEAIEIYFAALARAIGPFEPWEHPRLTFQQRALVRRGAAALAHASILLLSRYFPYKDCTFRGLITLLGLVESRPGNPKFQSPATLMFKQVSEGRKYYCVSSGWSWKPSRFVRTTDGLRPCDQIKQDGTHGFAASEEPTLESYEEYRECERAFARLNPRLNFALLVKRALLPLCPADAQNELFTERERAYNKLIEAADALSERYHARLLQGDESLDLLDRLSIESVLKVLWDERRACDERLPYLRLPRI